MSAGLPALAAAGAAASAGGGDRTAVAAPQLKRNPLGGTARLGALLS